MNADDPSATYRGYRRQALYALFRVFSDTLPDGATVQPEGREDLAVFGRDGRLLEIVQVKDHTDNLSASSFKPSFYKRISPYCFQGSATVVRIASFGPIGPDLQKAVAGDHDATSRVLKTITKTHAKQRTLADGSATTATSPGLSDSDARNIIDHLTLTELDEKELTDAILAALAQTVTAVDSRHAFDFLMWWLLTSSETQIRIDRNNAIAKVARIGRFLAQRGAFHDEWFKSIIPVAAPTRLVGDVERMKQEFFRGGRVRFEHISEDLDVPRERFLTEIHDAFRTENVVIVHSASGQGKTTLAYRYAREFAPEDFRFELLTPANVKHARQLALALIGHAEAIGVPTFVYVDARPGDDYWVEVVRQLASVIGIRVLVTVREEDWSRARISVADFSFAEVVLSFERSEAASIYSRLVQAAPDERHLDFEDAWSQFGKRHTLFEFVYYITQAESLAYRIGAQIDSLQEAVLRGERSTNELELLRLVAVASAYEARVDLVLLAAHCALPSMERTLERFHDEYLLRVSEDGRYVDGFHSIRSGIISNRLTDPVLDPWAAAACRCLPLIVEGDLHNFLLCAFSRHADTSNELLLGLRQFRPSTWVGILGVIASLMWNGLRKYVEGNAAVLQEANDKVGSGWLIMFDWDLGQVRGKEGLQIIERLSDIGVAPAKVAEFARSVRTRQTDKERVFSDLRDWLRECSARPVAPEQPNDFRAMAEVLFWIGHLDIATPLREAVTKGIVEMALNTLDVVALSEFMVGFRTCFSDVYEGWLRDNRERVIARVRRDASIIALHEDSDSMVAHFAIDLDRQASALRRRSGEPEMAVATIHDLTMERVELLSYVFEKKHRYGAIGYGHRMSLIEHGFDEADKPGVHANNLYAPWAPQFNALARGYVERLFRPRSWAEYLELLRSLRCAVLSAFSDLRHAIATLARPRGMDGGALLEYPAAWDECLEQLRHSLLVPRVATDEWGYVSESVGKRQDDARQSRYSSLRRFAPIQKAVGEYTRTVGNFMRQALECLVLVPYLATAESQPAVARLLATAEGHGINHNSLHLSIVNGIDACAAVGELQAAAPQVYGNEEPLGWDADFGQREREEFDMTMTLWCAFIENSQNKRNRAVASRRRAARSSRGTAARKLSELLTATRHRVRSELRGLRGHGIEARFLTETVRWDGKPALWIAYDTEHPVHTMMSVERLWTCLASAFESDREKTARAQVIELLWSRIVVVPLVRGKSLECVAMPHFKAATYSDASGLRESPWRLGHDVIPDEAWLHLGLERWTIPVSMAKCDAFTNAYALLFHHIDHMADFNRLPDKLDEMGAEVLQSYLDRENCRASPLLQNLFDSYAEFINDLPEINEELILNRPNIVACIQLLVELKDAVYPTVDFHNEAKLSLEDIVSWRDRLHVGLGQLGLARQLWLADSLGFGEWGNHS